MSWLTKLFSDGEQIHVLAVMPDTLDRGVLEAIAGRAQWDLTFSPTCDMAVGELKRHTADVIICDRDLRHCDWREALRRLALQAPGSPIIVSAADTDDHFWLEVIERGGYDVVTRPFAEAKLAAMVRLAARR